MIISYDSYGIGMQDIQTTGTVVHDVPIPAVIIINATCLGGSRARGEVSWGTGTFAASRTTSAVFSSSRGGGGVAG